MARLIEEARDGTVWLTFDRPDRLNAFTGTDYRDLRLALERATTDAAVRAVVLTGAGRAFSAGADRSLLDGGAPPDERVLAGEEFGVLLEVIGRCDKPVIAAVNGLAVGIGCTVLLHCDLVVAAESARFRLPFTSLGVVPEAGSSVLLPQTARWGDAMWAMLSSDWFDAPTAQAMGIVWRVVADEELMTQTERVATAITELDPAAVSATKRLLTAGRADLVRAAMEREHAAFGSLTRSSDDPDGGPR